MTDISLFGVKNNLKRDTSSGSASIAAPATVSAWVNLITTYTVTHNLGVIPKVRVYFEQSATDGKIYPAGGRRFTGHYSGIALDVNAIECLWEVTTTTLTIYLESIVAKTGNRNIYWVIYKDS